MTGDALLVSPVLHWNTQQAPAYFPPGRWYSLYDYSAVDAGAQGLNSTVHVRARLPARPSAHPAGVVQWGRAHFQHAPAVQRTPGASTGTEPATAVPRPVRTGAAI
jgi:hypothetical protein